MNDPIQNEAETQELRRGIPFRSATEDEQTREQVRLSTIQIGFSASLCLYLAASGLRSWPM